MSEYRQPSAAAGHQQWAFHQGAIQMLGGGNTSFMLVGVHAIGRASEYRTRTNKQ